MIRVVQSAFAPLSLVFGNAGYPGAKPPGKETMTLKISGNVASVEPSVTMAVTAKAKAMKAEGLDVLSFSAGEPDFDTPDFIKEAAARALSDGHTKYTPVSGVAPLREAICEKLKRDNALGYIPDQVLVSCGAKHSVYNAFHALLDPGDEALIPAPYWVSYPQMARLVGAKAVIVETCAENDFNPTVEDLERAVTERTRLIVFSTPGNPSGAVYTRETLEGIAAFAQKHNLAIISDEIYELLIYDGCEHHSIAGFSDDAMERTITINGHSKAYAMTGWRIGYAAGPSAVIKAMATIQSHTTSNANAAAQYAGLAALEADQEFVAPMVQAFDRRRKIMVEGLRAMEGVACRSPRGAFYAFPDVSGCFRKNFDGSVPRGSVAMAEMLLDRARVATVPGAGFGADAFLRLSYASSDDDIREGLKRISRLLEAGT